MVETKALRQIECLAEAADRALPCMFSIVRDDRFPEQADKVSVSIVEVTARNPARQLPLAELISKLGDLPTGELGFELIRALPLHQAGCRQDNVAIVRDLPRDSDRATFVAIALQRENAVMNQNSGKPRHPIAADEVSLLGRHFAEGFGIGRHFEMYARHSAYLNFPRLTCGRFRALDGPLRYSTGKGKSEPTVGAKLPTIFSPDVPRNGSL